MYWIRQLTVGIVDEGTVDIESDLTFLRMSFQGLPGLCC